MVLAPRTAWSLFSHFFSFDRSGAVHTRGVRFPFLLVVFAIAGCSDKTLKPPASDKTFDDSDDPGMTMTGTKLDAATDALPDGEGKSCGAQTECAAPLRCIFPIALGCGAQGMCALYADPPSCGSKLACGCDGKDVVLCSPDGFAPSPVKKIGACSPSDAATE